MSASGSEPFNAYRAGLDPALSAHDTSRPLYGATFGQAVRRFFANPVTFTGRASRSEYWWVSLFIALLNVIPMLTYTFGCVGVFVWIIARFASEHPTYGYGAPRETPPWPAGGALPEPFLTIAVVSFLLMELVSLALYVPNLALTCRRLQDANKPGLFALLLFVPYGSFVVFFLTLLGSDPRGRRFDLRREAPAEHGRANRDGAAGELSLPLRGATFIEASARCFKKYAVFTGRASRSEFWLAQLMMRLVFTVPTLIILVGIFANILWVTESTTLIAATDRARLGSWPGTPLAPSPLSFLVPLAVCALGLLLPQLTVSWRRLQDANLPGRLAFLHLILGVGPIIVFLLALRPPDPRGRRFDPR